MDSGDDGRGRGGKGVVLPDWAKFAIAVIAGTISAMVWMQSTFISRVEYASHAVQNAIDMERLAQTQKAYATAEQNTAAGLTDLKVDVAEIKGDVGWLRAYLDVTKPPPRRNGAAR